MVVHCQAQGKRGLVKIFSPLAEKCLTAMGGGDTNVPERNGYATRDYPMNITDEEELRVEALVGAWRDRLESHRRDHVYIAAFQVENWLFGLQIGLASLGLHDLATLAEAAQNFDTKE